MIVLAVLIQLPKQIILIIGIVLVAGHNLLDNVHVHGSEAAVFGWSLLHESNFFVWHGRNILVGYPVMPWIGVMALGYSFGNLYTPAFTALRRKKVLLLIGFSAIGLFILLRLFNIYGDAAHWSPQKTLFYTFLSFIKTSKYPPSLLYVLMTLGPAILFLAVTEKVNSAPSKIISVYGRVPMFYYLLHIYLIHLLAMIASEFFTKVDWRNWVLHQPLWFNDSLKGYGFPLWVVYLVWFTVVVSLYPLCKWYDRYKTNHKEKRWLSYL
ncbi:MAG: hypothetical protein JWP81_3756 [Ferruginibacter sp.]|nr:hypothetical protein [Ferruginibacter sp.]